MVFETNQCGSTLIFCISKTLKIILTIVVIIYTSFLIFGSLEIGRELYIRMEELRGILEQI
jgi:hypothetical protein